MVLPQPDSPTRPSVSPRRMSRSDPVDRLDHPDRPLQDAAADREVLDQAADLDQRRRGRPIRDRRRPGRRRWTGPASEAGSRLRSIPRSRRRLRPRQQAACGIVIKPAPDVVPGRRPGRRARVDVVGERRRPPRSGSCSAARTGSRRGASIRFGTLPGMTASSSLTSPTTGIEAMRPRVYGMERLARTASRHRSARRSRQRT